MGDGGRVLVGWISCGRQPGHFGTRISRQSWVRRNVLLVGNISHLREFTTVADCTAFIASGSDRCAPERRESSIWSDIEVPANCQLSCDCSSYHCTNTYDASVQCGLTNR
jgi:hypothetical protein